MIYTNKRELLRAIWENWQDCRPEKGEERDTICSSFIWEYMKNACQSEADLLCKMEMAELRGILELPGGIKSKGSGIARTKKYSRLLALEQLRKEELISGEDFYSGLEKLKKGITSKLANHPEGEKEILDNLEFILLKRTVEDYFTNNGLKLADSRDAEGLAKDEANKESIYEDSIWLYTEFRRKSRKSELPVSEDSNKARDEAYVKECEVFYQLLNQCEDDEMQRAIKKMFLPICVDPNTGMGVYLIGKDLYSPQEKESLCTACFLEFSSEHLPQMKEDRFISVDYSVFPFYKEGEENVRKAVGTFLDYLDCDGRGDRFLNYVDVNSCPKLLGAVPKSLLPYFFESDITTAEIEKRKEAEIIEERKQRDKMKRMLIERQKKK